MCSNCSVILLLVVLYLSGGGVYCNLSNFNNIFSKKWTKIELLKLFKTYKNLLFIIDETYINESDDSIYSCSICMNLFHNILIIKTLTNVFDTNIKYIVSNVELINKISI
jgi:hypothetical protein